MYDLAPQAHAPLSNQAVCQISLRSDLKNLCLVSKAWRSVAISKLYQRVVINLAAGREVEKFLACVSAGAGRHLSNTRVLILHDEVPPREPYNVEYDIIRHNRFSKD